MRYFHHSQIGAYSVLKCPFCAKVRFLHTKINFQSFCVISLRRRQLLQEAMDVNVPYFKTYHNAAFIWHFKQQKNFVQFISEWHQLTFGFNWETTILVQFYFWMSFQARNFTMCTSLSGQNRIEQMGKMSKTQNHLSYHINF